MAIDRKKSGKWFALPEGSDQPLAEIQQCSVRLANAILDNTPSSSDQSHAIRQLRDSFHWACEALKSE